MNRVAVGIVAVVAVTLLAPEDAEARRRGGRGPRVTIRVPNQQPPPAPIVLDPVPAPTPAAALPEPPAPVYAPPAKPRRIKPIPDDAFAVSDDKPICRYRPVMSNADYQACGLRPPSSP